MIRSAPFAAGLMLLMLAGISHAQGKPAVPPDYLLGPFDEIRISVRYHDDLTSKLVVMPDGKIGYAPVGELKAAGKSPAKLAAEIQAELEKTLNNAAVVVSVLSVNSQTVRVVGAVNKPGAYPYRREMRLVDLLALAGGLSARPAQISARLLRKDRVVDVSVTDAIASPQGARNVPLDPDDVIIVDQSDPVKNKVAVMGQVSRPGPVDLGDEGITLLALLAAVGNPLPDAALTKCYIQRGDQQIPVNLLPVLVSGKRDDPAAKMKLLAGDVLLVPRIESRIMVMGMVGHPGEFPIPEDRSLTLLDALGVAGGQMATADLSKCALARMTDGKLVVTPVNFDQMLKKHDLSKNVVLQEHDIIYVAMKGRSGPSLSDFLAPFAIFRYATGR